MRVWIAAILVLMSAANAFADDYPPYPDVWGRVFTAGTDRINGYYLREAGNGDFAVTYARSIADPQTGDLRPTGKWGLATVFSGRSTPVSEEEAAEATRNLRLPPVRVLVRGPQSLPLANGTSVKPSYREPRGVGCAVNYAGTLVLKNEKGEVIADKMVLRLLDPPELRETWDYCDRELHLDHVTAKVDALAFVLYPLADGTFLAEGAGSPVLIRFKPDLTSPFFDGREDLFLADTAEVDDIVRAAYRKGGSRMQAANDALLEYVMGLRAKR